jgi:hypothetical protein
MIDEPERGGGQPPLAAAPLAVPPRSRHDHYPRGHAELRRAMQHDALALESQWRAEDEGPGGIFAAMDRVAAAAPDAIFAALAPWLADTSWAQHRLSEALALCATHPFAMPPLRIFSGGALSGLILAERLPITLSLMIRPFNQPAPRAPSVIFSPGHGLTRIIRSGGASISRYYVALSADELAGGFRAAAAAPLERGESGPVTDGTMIRVDQQRESFNLTTGSGDLVMLQLFVHRPSRVPMREYDPDSRRLVRVAAAGRATSFRQMGLAVLRAFGRSDAAPLFAAALADDDFAMRWQVMREFLALAPDAALPHLAAMDEADPHAEVRAAAAATLALLRERRAALTPATEPA